MVSPHLVWCCVIHRDFIFVESNSFSAHSQYIPNRLIFSGVLVYRLFIGYRLCCSWYSQDYINRFSLNSIRKVRTSWDAHQVCWNLEINFIYSLRGSKIKQIICTYKNICIVRFAKYLFYYYDSYDIYVCTFHKNF